MNFGRKAKRVARRQYWHGNITREEYLHIKEACKDPEMVARWRAGVERSHRTPWREGRFDWSAIWDWFIENWPTILKVLLTLAPLMLEPGPDPDEEEVE
jgi:hypothetical protein